MQKRTSLLLILLISLIASIKLYAQDSSGEQSVPKFEYIIDFSANFDNLEASGPYEASRTLFGAKLAPQIGIKVAENSKIMGGIDLIQNFGDSIFPSHIDYTLYYRYDGKKHGALFGSFPRQYSIMSYPRAFFREDYYFYNTNIEGMMFQLKDEDCATSAEFFYDWYGLNQTLRIDEFLLVGAIRYKIFDGDRFNIGGDLLLNHFKNDYYLEDSYLLERFQSDLFISSDLSNFFFKKLDKLELTLSMLTSSEHKRVLETETSWQHSIGGEIGLNGEYKGFGVQNDLYIGHGQMIYYDQYGTEFYPGSTFYAAKRYNRSNFYYEWKNRLVTICAQMIFHFTPDRVANQQMITLSVNLGEVF
ncbi:MAG: hypothetical protein R3Y50_08370 [Rikenellaceae bacterium]